MACLHLLRDQLGCCIYVSTGYGYPETERMIEYANSIVPVHRVESNRKLQNEAEGIPSGVVPIDWTAKGQMISGKKPVMLQSYLGCCFDNISWPIMQKAKELGVKKLVYGQRGQDARKAPIVGYGVVDGIERWHPIENWTTGEVMIFLAKKMEIPSHYYLKQTSLDCYDCTGFHDEAEDRIEWTRMHYPDFHEAYRARRLAINEAVRQSLHLEGFDYAL